jgi:SAM-dependent methyltransferase
MSPAPDQPAPAKRAMDHAAVRDWPAYYAAMVGKPARETLTAALAAFEREGSAPGFAVDLGCGEGRDSLELLRRGWRVLAIDSHPDAFDLMVPRVPAAQRPRLETLLARFESARWPAADLVNASYALPFCDPGAFPAVWARITRSLRPSGRFAGQLFGDRHTWASLPDRSHHSEAEARALLRGLEVEEFRVEEKDDAGADGRPIHWHVYHIVARNPGNVPNRIP